MISFSILKFYKKGEQVQEACFFFGSYLDKIPFSICYNMNIKDRINGRTIIEVGVAEGDEKQQ